MALNRVLALPPPSFNLYFNYKREEESETATAYYTVIHLELVSPFLVSGLLFLLGVGW